MAMMKAITGVVFVPTVIIPQAKAKAGLPCRAVALAIFKQPL